MQLWIMSECKTAQSQIMFEHVTVQSWILFEHVTVYSQITFIQPNMHPFGMTECMTMNLT